LKGATLVKVKEILVNNDKMIEI